MDQGNILKYLFFFSVEKKYLYGEGNLGTAQGFLAKHTAS